MPPQGPGEKSARRAVREMLHEGTESRAVAREIIGLREESIDLASPASEESIESKREAYALTAYLLEQAYPRIALWIKENPDTIFFRPEDGNKFGLPKGEPYTREQINASLDADLITTIDDLRQAFFFISIDRLSAWATDMIKAGKETGAPYEVRAYARLQHVITDGLGYYNMPVPRFIARGANTASAVSWNLLKTIPVAYFQRFGTHLSAEEFRGIAERAEPLLLDLASMHLENFRSFSAFAQTPRLHQTERVEFGAEMFLLKDGPNGLELEFDQESVNKWKSTRSRNEYPPTKYGERIGCPARDARTVGPDGKKTNLVSEAYRYSRALADEFLVPRMETYVDAVLEKATAP